MAEYDPKHMQKTPLTRFLMRLKLGEQVQCKSVHICLVRYILRYVCARKHVCGGNVCANLYVLEVKLGPFRWPLRTAIERSHTHSHKQSNQFVYQTRHLMVILWVCISCQNKYHSVQQRNTQGHRLNTAKHRFGLHSSRPPTSIKHTHIR